MGPSGLFPISLVKWASTHEVLIALFDTGRQAYDHGAKIEDLGTPPLRNPVKKLYNLLLRSIRLVRVLRRECPDRILSFMESANFPTIMAASVVGLLDRLCISVRCNPARITVPKRLLIPIAYRLPGRIVVPSDGVRQALQNMGLPPHKLAVIPNPLAARLDNVAPEHGDIPMCFVLGVGRLEREKGFDRLLKAFAKVGEPDVHLVILGRGTERATLLAMSQELGIASRLHLPGVVTEVDTWYRRAHCFVLPSHSEGSPNVIIEAMVNGCPVVSFDCEYGPAEILEGGRSGMLVPQDDIAALSEAIRQLVSDGTLRARFSRVGKLRARAFSVERIAPSWLN